MSNENESSSQGVALDTNKRISYTREFLLSLAELDVCKKFPDEFEQSILSELLAARCGTPQPQGVPKETSSTANTLDNSIDPKQQENEEGENDRVKDEKQYSGGR